MIANSMALPTYIQPSHHPASHLFSDSPASTHAYPPPPPGPMPPSSDCGLSVPRLYASAHLAVDPGFLSHGSMGNPSPLTTPVSARYGLGGGDRDSGIGAGMSGSFGDPSTPAYYHYFSNVPDIGPAYTVAGGGGGPGCGGASMCGDFMSSVPLLPPLSANSAFTPARQQLVAPSRGKVENGLVSGDGLYGMMDTTPKTTK